MGGFFLVICSQVAAVRGLRFERPGVSPVVLNPGYTLESSES